MLNNKVIIIIGATGGIGRVLSKRFVEAGATVVLSSRSEDKLRDLSEDVGEKALPIQADASRLEDVEALFKKTQEHFGTIDAVVMTAGSWKRLTTDEPTSVAADLARSHFDALFLPSFVVGYIAQKFMREQGHGLIVNLSSHAAFRPELKGNLTYGPMKAASRHFILSLRHELEGTGVRLTDIEPAIVNTPDNSKLLDTPEKQAGAVQPEDIASWIIEHFDDPEIPATKLFDSKIVL